MRPNPPLARSMNYLLAVLLTLAQVAPPIADEAIEQRNLFRIEKSKNANVVQYDARVGPDGRLVPDQPVVVYWLRLAEDGRVKPLSWLQRTFAYGFDVELNRERDQATLSMNARIGRPVTVRCGPADCRATTEIDGASAYLNRVFVHAVGKGIGTRVVYTELFGEDVNGGGERYERIDVE